MAGEMMARVVTNKMNDKQMDETIVSLKPSIKELKRLQSKIGENEELIDQKQHLENLCEQLLHQMELRDQQNHTLTEKESLLKQKVDEQRRTIEKQQEKRYEMELD